MVIKIRIVLWTREGVPFNSGTENGSHSNPTRRTFHDHVYTALSLVERVYVYFACTFASIRFTWKTDSFADSLCESIPSGETSHADKFVKRFSPIPFIAVSFEIKRTLDSVPCLISAIRNTRCLPTRDSFHFVSYSYVFQSIAIFNFSFNFFINRST